MTIVLASADDDATRWNGQGKLLIAPDGTCGVFLFDGSSTWTLYKAADVASAWSSVTVVTGALNAGSLAAVMDRSTGDIHVVYKRSGGPLPTYRKFTFGSGTWTMGSAVNIAVTGDYANDAAPPHITLDRNGYIWVQMSEWVGGYARRVFYSATGATWTDHFNGGAVSQNGSAAHIAPCYSGGTDYILTTYQSGGDIRWNRCTTTGGTIGAMNAQQLENFSLHDDHSSDMLMLPDGRVLLVVAPQGGNEYAIRTLIYDPTTDDWSYPTASPTWSDIGRAVQDRWPALALNPTTGTVYCVWDAYNATDDYSVVYREFDPLTNTWGILRTLQGPGDKYSYTLAYCDGTNLLTVQTGGYFSIGVWVESFTASVVNDNDYAGTFNGTTSDAQSASAWTSTLTGDFTVECWFRDTNTDYNHGDSLIIGHGGPGSTWAWWMQVRWRGASLGIRNNWNESVVEFGIQGAGPSPLASPLPPPNTWHHLAFTYKASDQEVNGYLDGVLVTTATHPQVLVHANITSKLAIGVNPNGSNYWLGRIDEVRVWDGIRTPTEIADNRDARMSGSETGLVLLYNFDDGSTVSDLTSTNLDLTPSNVTWSAASLPLLESGVVNGLMSGAAMIASAGMPDADMAGAGVSSGLLTYKAVRYVL